MILSKEKVDKILGIGFVILGICILLLIPSQILGYTGYLSGGPETLFFLIAILLVILGFSLFFQKVKDNKYDLGSLQRSIIVLIALVLDILILQLVGFVISSILLMVFLMRFFGYQNWFKSIIISVIVVLVITYVFGRLMNVILPSGILFNLR